MANTATKSASTAASAAAANAAAQAKLHKRSRSGCFTCRLRRKKCDEGKNQCKACRNLGLHCEYKRPSWWANVEARKKHKEDIKHLIKSRKAAETAAAHAMTHPTPSPDLSQSAQDSDYSELNRARSVSVDSQFSSVDFDFNSCSSLDSYGSYTSHHSVPSQFGSNFCMSPYEYETKAERQTYFNDHLAANSSVSSFSSFHSIDAYTGVPVFPGENWLQDDFDGRRGSIPAGDMFPPSLFDFSHSGLMAMPLPMVDTEDQRLLNHFTEHVVKLIFPILELNAPGSARNEVIMPALESNKCFMHCCLSVAALHLKTTRGLQTQEIDNDITRHRYACISTLCMALNQENEPQQSEIPQDLDIVHFQILEATLAMIIFQCCVGRVQDDLPDIPWHQHFQAVTSLVNRLNLPQELSLVTSLDQKRPPFNMTMTAWVDILGATMLGQSPQFADTYRDKHLSSSPSGLKELMGCDDRVMYVISEIACLEGLKRTDQIDEMLLCDHVQSLGYQLDLTEPVETTLEWPYSATGEIQPVQLSKNITAVFRLAARIYLCSLVALFDRREPNIIRLVDRLVEALEFIPQGQNGYDRTIVWPMLVGGYVAVAGSKFRDQFNLRVQRLGELAEFGSFGRMVTILRETWKLADSTMPNVHWRDVTETNKWEFLLI